MAQNKGANKYSLSKQLGFCHCIPGNTPGLASFTTECMSCVRDPRVIFYQIRKWFD